MSEKTVQIIDGLSTIAEHYDVLFCDVWGVVHNGVAAWPEAISALETFRARGGAVILITNAPRPSAPIIRQLVDFGVTDKAYDGIVTSGDTTRGLIAEQAPAPAYFIGPDRDLSIMDGLGVERVAPEAAEFIVCTGLFDDVTETPEDYRAAFEGLIARDLHLICANPDRIIERGSEIIYCAGALSDLYEEMGGKATMVGKPFPAIYSACEQRLLETTGRKVARERILTIGDSLRTDLRGGLDGGFGTLFVAAGIHGRDMRDENGLCSDKVNQLFAEDQRFPDAVIPGLTW